MKPSPALSIVQNGPPSFAGRKVGVLITDGVDRKLFDALKKAVTDEGAQVEVIAPTVGGAVASDRSIIEAQQKVGGGPLVLYDAVAILTSDEDVADLLDDAAAKDFVTDAFAHLKFVAYNAPTAKLLQKARTSGFIG